ncbi:MAG: MerR family transcriptional regulator [Actinomycetales bacterium]|nr:MerR family transcriptional regulator [Actinomycetales bacterium]
MRAARGTIQQIPGRGDEQIRLTVAAVAARLGVAAPTLRTWDRRYGLGPSDHTAGSHRRYNAADIERLETMRRLTLEGVAPADAARFATRKESAAEVDTRVPVEDEPDDGSELIDPLSLAAAAVEADEARVRRLLRRAVHASSPLTIWRTLVRPALDMVEVREHSDRPGRDPEEMLRSAMFAVVRARDDASASASASAATEAAGADGGAAGAAAGSRTVRLVIYPDEGLHVDAHVLAGELATRGIRARVLRAGSGSADPDAVVRALMGADVWMTVLLGAPAGAESMARGLVAHGSQVFVISPSAEVAALDEVYRARTLPGAVHEIEGLLAEAEAGAAVRLGA